MLVKVKTTNIEYTDDMTIIRLWRCIRFSECQDYESVYSTTNNFYVAGIIYQLTSLSIQQLCSALNINKKSVDRDLDVYRNLLSKLVQAKELLKEYIDR